MKRVWEQVWWNPKFNTDIPSLRDVSERRASKPLPDDSIMRNQNALAMWMVSHDMAESFSARYWWFFNSEE
jgi:hypothetical protein